MLRFLKILFSFLFLVSISVQASHNRAGEITYQHIGGDNSLEYEITITTYTKTSSVLADRPSLDSVHLGDGTIEQFSRTSFKDTIADIRVNKYIKRHTYPGNGSYTIYFIDPNRNAGVINVPNSFYTPFAIQSLLVISENIKPRNSSPILLYPPVDQGCKHRIFKHNPVAYDPDGKDSLSYELTVCRGAGNQPIPGYTFPHATSSFGLNPRTGDLIWNAPDSVGEYNVAFYIKEWRGGILIGQVERDMQIRIENCQNHPPTIQNLVDTCVLAGDSIGFNVTAIDVDGDLVTMSSFGEPYLVKPDTATFIFPPNNGKNDTVTGIFSWNTACSNIRRLPYWVEFRAQDSDDTTLVDLKGLFISVIGPAPKNLTVTPNGSGMDLHWSPDSCTNAVGYNIYRKEGLYNGTIQCPCQTGVPSFTGYSLIGSIRNGLNDTTFHDTNNGQGLSVGITYCYMVTAVFPAGQEGCASAQVCARLKKDLPVITHVTIDSTSNTTGSDTVMWSKATEIDTAIYPPPYQYKIYRTPAVFLATLPTENDTIYKDTSIDTDTKSWSYYVELYYDSAHLGVPVLKGKTQTASSVFLTLTPTDEKIILSWNEAVPWNNYRYDVFKYNGSSWDSIGNTANKTFADDSLVNGQTYCYYVRSVGTYGTGGIIDPIINLSEQECAVPVDNVPPCPPQLTISADCIEVKNFLQWTNPNNNLNDSCSHDVEKYYIYYSPDSSMNFEVIQTNNSANDTTFIHENITTLAGCYKVTAIDTLGNESAANIVCVDTCRQYVLPSIFTPNGDGNNDFFHPCDSTTSADLQKKNCPPYLNVKDVDMKIFNRWGNLVFETTDKDINWDGTNKDSKGNCPDGIYYYTCKVNFFRLNGIQTIELHGYIHLIRGK